MRRIPIEPNPPLGASKGLRGGDRGGSHGRPLEICDDSVNIGAKNAGWDQETYMDKGELRVRLTRRI